LAFTTLPDNLPINECDRNQIQLTFKALENKARPDFSNQKTSAEAGLFGKLLI